MASYHRLNLILRSFRRDGIVGGFRTIWSLLRDRLVGQYRLLFAMSDDKARGIDISSAPPLAIRCFESWPELDEDSKAFLAANQDKIHWDVRKHMDEGMAVWIGFANEKPVTIAQTRPGQNVNVYFFPMTERCALVSHCFTTPDARGRGYYVAILKHVCRALADEGFTRIYIDCSDSNLSSERGILSTGFLPIGKGLHRRNGTTRWRQETPPSIRRLEG